MAIKAELGTLERVDLRECWELEDADFTPWLAQEDNLRLLSETVEIDLEPIEVEAGVGRFRADILCRNADTETPVIIENQLGRTDHSHLGQTLTYAAGLQADTIIWIARRFTDEHRAALDWLNRNTHENIQFFGIEIELWRIGDSPVAPRFSLVVEPNEWAKQVRDASAASRPPSKRQQGMAQFWEAFGAYLEEQGADYKAPEPLPRTARAWSLGRTGVRLRVGYHGELRIAVHLTGRNHQVRMKQLLLERDAIERELGFGLVWIDHRRDSSSARVAKNIDVLEKANWPTAFPWILDQMKKLDAVFRPRLSNLTDEMPDEADDDEQE